MPFLVYFNRTRPLTRVLFNNDDASLVQVYVGGNAALIGQKLASNPQLVVSM